MEATGEDLTLLHKILPPRLEEAGLENCALPPSSIQEAFLKAASAVGCISGVEPETVDSDSPPPSDVLVGVVPETDPPGPCTAVKGVTSGEGGGDVVFVGGNDEKNKDVVVVGESGEGGDCVGGLKGLDGIKEKKEEKENDDVDQDEKKKPTLVEGFFFNA